MKPNRLAEWVTFSKAAILIVVLGLTLGCTSPFLLTSSSEPDEELAEFDPEQLADVQLIRDVTIPWGMNYLKLEGVALVTGLDNTGSDPAPSARRDTLIGEMQTYDVKNPNLVLASPETSLVLVRSYLPPGVQKGDHFDVEVRVASRSDSTSLRDGWLMRARMRQTAMIDSAIHTGDVEGLVEGPVVVDAVFDGDEDEVNMVHGRVLGGGISAVSRPLGLAVRSDNHSIKTASLVGAAINGRFHTYDRGVKRGVAEPKRDNFVELEVHPRYKQNLARYVRVIQNIALKESPIDRVRRIESLEQMLLEPTTSPLAALRLEAIGKEAIPVLRKGLLSDLGEVRFYAAEALAYLDEPAAAEVLAETAREEPAFRWHAIAALSAVDHATAYEELSHLMNVSSAETRYAAFRAMRERNPLDPTVRGEQLDEQFSFHAIDSTGPPMVHLSRSRVAEVVAFGHGIRLESPSFLYAGKNILLKAVEGDQIKVMRFAAHEEDQETVCSSDLRDVVRAIVEMGGGYADVIQCLQEAKQRELLDARVVVDALPHVGRKYRREDGDEETDAAEPVPEVGSPLPEMFQNRLEGASDDEEEGDLLDIDAPEHLQPPGFFDKLKDSVYRSDEAE